jgi:hypothetical protein
MQWWGSVGPGRGRKLCPSCGLIYGSAKRLCDGGFGEQEGCGYAFPCGGATVKCEQGPGRQGTGSAGSRPPGHLAAPANPARQQVAVGCSASSQRPSDKASAVGRLKPMTTEHAAQLLLDQVYQPGARPFTISSLPFSPGGWIFKETFAAQGTAQQRGNRRRSIARGHGGLLPDYWHVTGGKKNVEDTRIQCGRWIIRRRHGCVEQRASGSACTRRGSFSYIEYRLMPSLPAPPPPPLEPPSKSPPSQPVHPRPLAGLCVVLYYVFPKPASSAAAAARGQDVASSGARRSKGGRAAVEFPMQELGIIGTRGEVAAGRPVCTLRAPAGDDFDATFVRFDKGGVDLGSIRESGRGVKLHSAGGDVAEYHRLRDDCPAPLAEGEVVGFWGGELAQRTRGADMVGVVTRKAMVVGSLPSDDQAHRYDTVAYAGRVPVRVRGPASCGDWVGPSGREDGTAVVCEDAKAAIGTIITGDQIQSFGTVRQLEISVIAPGAAAAGGVDAWGGACAKDARARRRRRYATVLVAALLLGLVCVCGAWRGPSRALQPPETGANGGGIQQPISLDAALSDPISCTSEAAGLIAQLCGSRRPQTAPGGGLCAAGCSKWMRQLLVHCSLNVSTWAVLHPELGLPGRDAVAAAHSVQFPAQLGQLSAVAGCARGSTRRSLQGAGRAAAARGETACLIPLGDGVIEIGQGRVAVALFDAQELRNKSQLLELELAVPKMQRVLNEYPWLASQFRPNQDRHLSLTEDSLIVHGVMLAEGQSVWSVWPQHAQLMGQVPRVGWSGVGKVGLPLDVISARDGGTRSTLALFLSSNSSAIQYYAGTMAEMGVVTHGALKHSRTDLSLRVTSDPADLVAWRAAHALPEFATIDAVAAAQCLYGDPLCIEGPLNLVPPGLHRKTDCSADRAKVLGLLLAPPGCTCEPATAKFPVGGSSCCASPERGDACTAVLEDVRLHCDPRATHGSRHDPMLSDPELSYKDLCERQGCVPAIGRAVGRAEDCEGKMDSREGSNWTFPSRVRWTVLLSLCSSDGVIPLSIAKTPRE